jgi:hypothetical protein
MPRYGRAPIGGAERSAPADRRMARDDAFHEKTRSLPIRLAAR